MGLSFLPPSHQLKYSLRERSGRRQPPAERSSCIHIHAAAVQRALSIRHHEVVIKYPMYEYVRTCAPMINSYTKKGEVLWVGSVFFTLASAIRRFAGVVW